MSKQEEKEGKTNSPFDELAARYDAWFGSPEGKPIFEMEVACLRDLIPIDGGRWLEVGVGSGRFAQALGVKEGIDPSIPMLELARQRGLLVKRGGERISLIQTILSAEF